MVRSIQVTAISVVVFLLPLVMWPGLTDYNYAKTIVGLIAISVLLVLWGLDAWREDPWTIHVPWLVVALLGLVVAGGLSAIHAADSMIVTQSLVLLVAFILLMWMIANVVQDEQDARWILVALLASGSLAAIYGVLQWAGVVPGSPGETGILAIISTTGNRNHLGGLLLYLFYPCSILLLHGKHPWAKALSLVLLVVCFTVMLLVRQMGTRMVFAAITLTLGLCWLIFRPAKCSRSNRRWLTGLAVSILIVLASSLLLPSRNESIVRSSSTTHEETWLSSIWRANSGEEREWFWRISGEMLADHPITGIGLGNFKVVFTEYEADVASTPFGERYDVSIDRVSQAHNEFVQVGAEMGLIGLLMLLCSLCILALSVWIRLRHIGKHARLDLMLLGAGILSILIHGTVSFPAHVAGSSLELVVFCGLALSLRFGNAASFSWTLRGWKAKGAHVLLASVAAAVCVFAIADLRANSLMERGISLVQQGAYALGETALQRSLELDFAPRQTYYYLAVAQIRLGRTQEAEANLEKSLTRFLDREVLLTYANLELSLGKLENAQTSVDVILAGNPGADLEQQARYILGAIAVRRQQIDRAIQTFESLTREYPEYTMGFVALGQVYAATDRAVLARENFQIALNLIAQSVRDARTQIQSLEGSSLARQAQIQAQIELLTQQQDYLISQLEQLPKSF